MSVDSAPIDINAPSGIARGANLRRLVTTIDVWKTLALALILVDHVGHYLVPDENWLRVVGRSSLPIWFFMIGFAGGRAVPWSWIGLAVGLTLVDLLRLNSLADAQLNILFAFAAIRVALPAVEQHLWPHPLLLAALALALTVLAPLSGDVVEYGTTGALLALVGVAHRHRLGQPGLTALGWRIGLALLAGLVFVLVESGDYAFDGLQTAVLAVLVAGVSLALLGFERAALAAQPAAPLAALLRFCGRYSLWLYAGQILLLAALAAALGIEDTDDEPPT